MELRYGQIEAALADALDIKEAAMGAFRARIRYLRNIGVPSVAGPGKGKVITYELRHALEILLTLELQNVGQSPTAAAALTGTILRQYDEHDARDLLALVEPSTTLRPPAVTLYFGAAMLMKHMEKIPPIYLLINVSHFANQLKAALQRVLEPD